MDMFLYIMWFIIVLALVMLVMVLMRPIFILERDSKGQIVDRIIWGRAFLLSLLVAVLTISGVALYQRGIYNDICSLKAPTQRVGGSRRVLRVL